MIEVLVRDAPFYLRLYFILRLHPEARIIFSEYLSEYTSDWSIDVLLPL